MKVPHLLLFDWVSLGKLNEQVTTFLETLDVW